MNPQTEISDMPAARGVLQTEDHRSKALNLRRLALQVDPTASVLPPTILDCRIDSLKVLAQALMHEIIALETQAIASPPAQLNLQTEVQRFEAELIRSALIRTGGRQRRAARLLGMKVTTLNTKIKRYKIIVD